MARLQDGEVTTYSYRRQDFSFYISDFVRDSGLFLLSFPESNALPEGKTNKNYGKAVGRSRGREYVEKRDSFPRSTTGRKGKYS